MAKREVSEHIVDKVDSKLIILKYVVGGPDLKIICKD